MKIYKYPLMIDDVQTVVMPHGAKVLTVQMQHEMPCLWAEVDPQIIAVETRTFGIIGTGCADIPANAQYIGTVQQFGGNLVWHVYELV